MTDAITTPTHDVATLVADATRLIVTRNAASVSLLQRHFRLGYGAGCELMAALEQAGLVTGPGSDGVRQLTAKAQALRPADAPPTTRELFEAWAIDPLEGGDGGDPGSPDQPSTWLVGIEHGDAKNLPQEPEVERSLRDYSIDKQLTYPYNVKAFKLLAAIHGEPVEQYEAFARRHLPFVRGHKGYFKGNIYPYPANSVDDWSAMAIAETGFATKAEYVAWCDTHRIPAITQAVRLYRPRLFIGVGTTFVGAFSRAFFGAEIALREHHFIEDGRLRRIYFAKHDGQVFVVIPHLNFRAHCLNTDSAIQTAGSFIAGLLG
jgi:hypothetical protein